MILAVITTTVLTSNAFAETLAQARRRELSPFEITKIKRYFADLNGIPRSQLKNYQLDHKVPLALGGSNDLSNLQLLTVQQHALKTKNDIKTITQARTFKVANPISFQKSLQQHRAQSGAASTRLSSSSLSSSKSKTSISKAAAPKTSVPKASTRITTTKNSPTSTSKTVHVKSYTKKNGTVVPAHTRSAPKSKKK